MHIDTNFFRTRNEHTRTVKNETYMVKIRFVSEPAQCYGVAASITGESNMHWLKRQKHP